MEKNTSQNEIALSMDVKEPTGLASASRNLYTGFKKVHEFVAPLGERNFGPSQTVPDQSVTIDELISRIASGMPVNSHKFGTPVFNEEFPPIEAKALDPVEVEEFRRKTDAIVREKAKKVARTEGGDNENPVQTIIDGVVEKLRSPEQGGERASDERGDRNPKD